MSQISLNPNEVLAHLKNILGSNLYMTNDELQSFLHDLRKIIRKDQKLADQNKENSDRSETCSCQCHLQTSSGLKLTEENISDSMDMDVDCTVSTSSYKYDLKLQMNKPAPSFIRPWRTRPVGKGNKNVALRDPVQLYHQYKNLWQQHHVPGEQDHATIRWNIREKMLGQGPQPRPKPLISAQSSHR